MLNASTIFICISCLTGVVVFLSLGNLIISIGVMAVYLLCALLIFIPMIKKFNKTSDRYHQCFHFINNLIISLSIKKSIAGAFESTYLSMDTEFQDTVTRLENIIDYEKLKYLESYFPFHSYSLFLQIISLWTEEGGDILKMSNYLLSEIRKEDEYVSSISSIGKRKYGEMAILWGFTLTILILLRFSLSTFYEKIKSLPLYIWSVVGIMAFVLVSIYLLLNKSTKLEIKGHENHEKIV